MKEEKLENIRHSLSHLLASAVLEIWTDAKPAIGPAIENGFYYDFEFSKPITESDLEKIEKKMREILPTWNKFESREVDENEAKEKYKNNPYKLELIEELLKDGKKLSFYKSGNYEELCGGGHAKDANEIKPDAFKLTKIAGAYWRGDEKNKMLTRIYGVAFESKKDLAVYLEQQEEAQKRDHRVLGKKLGLYTIDPEVGIGLPLWKPNGAIILSNLRRWFEDEQLSRGYLPVFTPHIGRKQLWETSGHWGFYNDSMYPPLELGQTLEDYQDKRKPSNNETYLLKPMNCPFHIKIYNSDPHSYRDLPIKLYEFGTVYRYEQKGELGGLTRVRGFTQDDAHIICSKEQLAEEFGKVIDFAFFVLKETFGFEIEVYASFKDPAGTKYLGEEKDWEIAEKTIVDILEDKKIDYTTEEGEAAFYGPKIDLKVKDSIGRKWQLSTVQFDFNLPERFKMTYTDKDGSDVKPFVVHRALLGSLERFMAILIEHYAGAFPVWLSPTQVWVLPIGENQQDYAKKVFEQLQKKGIRVKLHDENESLGKKIRNAKIEKIPYMLIIGDKEISENKITIESRDNGNLGQKTTEKFIEQVEKEIREKK